MNTNMYKPKESHRCQPKVQLPITLADQCLNSVISLLTKAGTRLAKSSRNSREKKGFRDYLFKNLPACLQDDILQRAVDQMMDVQTTLNLLDILGSEQKAREKVDLLGPFRLGFGCYVKEGRLTWSQGSARKFNLTLEQCDKLYTILLWSKPAQLNLLNISVTRDAIKSSKLPNIIAQARTLTSITLLSGAENHILRILGINCPNLKHIDVSHSIRVTDQGLRNLLLKRPRQSMRSQGENEQTTEEVEVTTPTAPDTNVCAGTLQSITLLGTSVTWEGCEYACKVMNFGYLCASLPLVKIVRVEKSSLIEKSLPYERSSFTFAKSSSLCLEDRAAITSSAECALLPEDLKNAVVDYFSKPTRTGESRSYVFIRQLNGYKLNLHFKMDASIVTSLVLPWYTFTWRLDSLLELDMLGLSFPNLRHLIGRVKGVWNRVGEKFLPKLQVAHVWSLNSPTGLSFLKHAPSLRIFEFNNTDTLAVEPGRVELDDATLEVSLAANSSLAQTLQEITIRPSSLTVTALKMLIRHCPNLTRIGDLEAWQITSHQIAEFNRYLDSERSQCVLSVMNFPPSKVSATFLDLI